MPFGRSVARSVISRFIIFIYFHNLQLAPLISWRPALTRDFVAQHDSVLHVCFSQFLKATKSLSTGSLLIGPRACACRCLPVPSRFSTPKSSSPLALPSVACPRLVDSVSHALRQHSRLDFSECVLHFINKTLKPTVHTLDLTTPRPKL